MHLADCFTLFVRWSLCLSLFWLHVFSIDLSGCLPGCECSPNGITAACCLWSSFPSKITTCIYDPDPSGGHNRPHNFACSPSWRELLVQLTPNSWSRAGKDQKPVLSNACNQRLLRLAFKGSTASEPDGLVVLEAKQLRELFFPTSGAIALRRLSFQRTSIVFIEEGFLTKLSATQLTELEIGSNDRLTSGGLGRDWLANTPTLQLLDLSHNRLDDINVTSWGLPFNSSLEQLILSHNQIQHLRSHCFVRLSNLRRLVLAYNRLTVLRISAFHGLENLVLLDLRGNMLTLPGLQVDLSSINIWPKLHRLDLSYNPLVEAQQQTSDVEINWWLSVTCPASLTVLRLDSIVKTAAVKSPSPNKLDPAMLPPIAWSQCTGLKQLSMQQKPSWLCLPNKWLSLKAWETDLPVGVRIHPPSLGLCPAAKYSQLPSVSTSTLSPSSTTNTTLSAVALNDLPLLVDSSLVTSTNLSPTQSTQSDRLLQEKSPSSWFIFGIICLLLLVVVVTTVVATTHCLRLYNERKQRHGNDRTRWSQMDLKHDQQTASIYGIGPYGFLAQSHPPTALMPMKMGSRLSVPQPCPPSELYQSLHIVADDRCSVNLPTSHAYPCGRPTSYMLNKPPLSPASTFAHRTASTNPFHDEVEQVYAPVICPSASFSSLTSFGRIAKSGGPASPHQRRAYLNRYFPVNVSLMSGSITSGAVLSTGQIMHDAATSTEELSTDNLSSIVDKSSLFGVDAEVIQQDATLRPITR